MEAPVNDKRACLKKMAAPVENRDADPALGSRNRPLVMLVRLIVIEKIPWELQP